MLTGAIVPISHALAFLSRASFDGTCGMDGLQGMLLAWNFNQYEAFQSFSMARELDPSAPMASWGVAYSLGPGANR